MILVDSDILIANLRGVDAARSWLHRARQHSRRLAASVIVITELTGGMRSPERREVTRLLDSLRAVPVSEAISYRAGQFQRRYRRSHSNIGVADYLIAATADVHGLELATLNVKHFPMFDQLRPPFES